MKNLRTISAMAFVLAFIIASCGEKPKTETSNEEEKTEQEVTEKAVEDTPKEVETAPVLDESLIATGKTIFNEKCIACHKLDVKLIGPALKGVTTRRSDEWITKMIINPTEMLANDPDAKKLLAEYNNVPMAPLGIDDAGAKALLEYFKSIDLEK